VWVKQGYLEKFNKSSNKDPNDAEFVWGPRAKVEWVNDSIQSFVLELMGTVNTKTKESVKKAGAIEIDHLL
jgi:hypothetical protein